MNTNLNLYKFFYGVAKYGSFTKASEKMMVSQSALSYSIKTLEENLGVTLFERKNSKITLTEEGEELLTKVGPFMEQLKQLDLLNKITKINIKVAIRPSIASTVLSNFLYKFTNQYENINLIPKIRIIDELADCLRNGEVDFVVDTFPIETSNSNFANKKVSSNLPTCYYCNNETFKKINKELVNFEDLKNYKIIYNNRNNISIKIDDVYANDLKFEYCDSDSMIVEKVKNTNYIGLSPYYLIKKEADLGNLTILNTTFEVPKYFGYLSYIKKNEQKYKHFISFVENYCKAFEN